MNRVGTLSGERIKVFYMKSICEQKNTLNQKLLMEEIIQKLTQEKSPSLHKTDRKEAPYYDPFEDAFYLEDALEDDLEPVMSYASYSAESVDFFESLHPSTPAAPQSHVRSLAPTRYGNQSGLLLGVILVSFIALSAIISSLP